MVEADVVVELLLLLLVPSAAVDDAVVELDVVSRLEPEEDDPGASCKVRVDVAELDCADVGELLDSLVSAVVVVVVVVVGSGGGVGGRRELVVVV